METNIKIKTADDKYFYALECIIETLNQCKNGEITLSEYDFDEFTSKQLDIISELVYKMQVGQLEIATIKVEKEE